MLYNTKNIYKVKRVKNSPERAPNLFERNKIFKLKFCLEFYF